MQMLNDASISIYPVDARGLVVFFPGADSSRIRGINTFNQAVFEATRQTMVNIADMTGGRAFYNRNDLDVAFQKAADDSITYYMLGYYLDKNAKPGWHKLRVKLKRISGEVRARNGFFVSQPSKQADTQKMDIRLALASPLSYTGLPIAVRWIGAEPAGAKKKVHFEVDLPPSSNVLDKNNQNHVSVEFVAAVRTGTGEPVDQMSEHVEANMKTENAALFDKQGLNYTNVLVVPPGEYTARFVVRDNITGRMGSLTAPMRVAP
jgi:hypothetical protein